MFIKISIAPQVYGWELCALVSSRDMQGKCICKYIQIHASKQHPGPFSPSGALKIYPKLHSPGSNYWRWKAPLLCLQLFIQKLSSPLRPLYFLQRSAWKWLEDFKIFFFFQGKKWAKTTWIHRREVRGTAGDRWWKRHKQKDYPKPQRRSMNAFLGGGKMRRNQVRKVVRCRVAREDASLALQDVQKQC